MKVKIDSVALGVIRDAMPEELPLGAWSSLSNMSIRDGFLTRSPGLAQLFSAPSIEPRFIAPFRTADGLLWIHAGLTKAFVDNAGTRTEITRASPFTGAVANRWVGGSWNGLFVMTNGVDKPQFWNGNTTTAFADLTNWTATKLCKVIRGFRGNLVALDITTSGTRYPFRVLWSSLADPGTVPPSWDTADPSREANEIDVAGAAGPLVDALPLGDQLIIYSPSSMHSMREVGGPFVMNVQQIPGRTGMLAKHCVADTPLGHVVLTAGDVVVHQGGPAKSIATGRVRNAIFDEIDNGSAENACFVAANPAANEVWVCYPTDSANVAKRAAVWNWAQDAWTFRELPATTAGATGQTPLPQVGDTWATITGAWNASATAVWGGKAIAPNDLHLVLAHTTPHISLADAASGDLGTDIIASAERIGMHLGEPDRVKLCRGVWLRIDGPAGTEVSVQIGASMAPDVSPNWQTAVTYTVGTSVKIDSFAAGRYLALRLSSTTGGVWRLRGLELDVVLQGGF